MGWMIVCGRRVYGMYLSEADAREVQSRVGGELMTSEEYERYAEEQNEEIRKAAGFQYDEGPHGY